MLLTFEINHDVDELTIHCDDEGLRTLIAKLQKMALRDKPSHIHLMTPSWSGMELTEEKQSEADTLINQVNVRLW